MGRIFLALIAFAVLASPAVAGRRCYRSNYGYGYTLRNSYSWPSNCWQCHPKKAAEPYNWRKAITTIEAQKVETAAFLEALQTISPPQQQPMGYVQQSSYGALGYASTLQGELATFGPQGQTLYGVNSVVQQTPPWDRNVLMHQRGQLTEQLQAFARADAQDLSDLNATAHAQAMRERELEITTSSILQAQRGNQPAPVNQVFRFSATTTPTGQVVIQPDQPQGPPAMPQFEAANLLGVMQSRCASCHSGANVQGKFDVGKLATLNAEQRDDIAKRVSLPPDDPNHMPKASGADGFGPGPALDRKEINLIEDWAWGTQ